MSDAPGVSFIASAPAAPALALLLVLLASACAVGPARVATTPETGYARPGGWCPVEVRNDLSRRLVLRYAGIGGGRVAGEVDPHGSLRFTVPCSLKELTVLGTDGESTSRTVLARTEPMRLDPVRVARGVLRPTMNPGPADQ